MHYKFIDLPKLKEINMKYWKRIKMKDLETIQHKSLKYIKNNRDKFVDAPFSPINFKSFVEAVPEFMSAFEEYDITPVQVSAYIMYSNSDGAAHKDYLTDSARINIPIINCENSWTNFYKLVVPGTEPKVVVNSKGQPYISYSPEDIVLEDRVQIIEPTIIRPLEIHSIEMDDTRVPRITLTVCTRPVPEFLLMD
jgi:hypothetical protein